MTFNKKLQIKFTVITMIAVTLIIIAILGVVTYENYTMTYNQPDSIQAFKIATFRSLAITRWISCFNFINLSACIKKNFKSYF